MQWTSLNTWFINGVSRFHVSQQTLHIWIYCCFCFVLSFLYRLSLLYCHYCSVMHVTVMTVSAYMALAFVFGFIPNKLMMMMMMMMMCFRWVLMDCFLLAWTTKTTPFGNWRDKWKWSGEEASHLVMLVSPNILIVVTFYFVAVFSYCLRFCDNLNFLCLIYGGLTLYVSWLVFLTAQHLLFSITFCESQNRKLCIFLCHKHQFVM